MSQTLNIILLIIAFSSLALIALTFLEGAIQIWLPRDSSPRFWSFFDRLLLTLRYVSASEEKLSRVRAQLSTAANLARSEVRDVSTK